MSNNAGISLDHLRIAKAMIEGNDKLPPVPIVFSEVEYMWRFGERPPKDVKPGEVFRKHGCLMAIRADKVGGGHTFL